MCGGTRSAALRCRHPAPGSGRCQGLPPTPRTICSTVPAPCGLGKPCPASFNLSRPNTFFQFCALLSTFTFSCQVFSLRLFRPHSFGLCPSLILRSLIRLSHRYLYLLSVIQLYHEVLRDPSFLRAFLRRLRGRPRSYWQASPPRRCFGYFHPHPCQVR